MPNNDGTVSIKISEASYELLDEMKKSYGYSIRGFADKAIAESAAKEKQRQKRKFKLLKK